MKIKKYLSIFICFMILAGFCVITMVPASATMPQYTFGAANAGVNFSALLGQNINIFMGKYTDSIYNRSKNYLYQVLGEEENDGKITVQSKEAVDNQPYDASGEFVHYSESDIRKWLNDDSAEGFLSFFSPAEQAAIAETEVVTNLYDSSVEGIITGEHNGKNYPLKTSDKAYLPWASKTNEVYWSAGNTENTKYMYNNIVTMKPDHVYSRLRNVYYAYDSNYYTLACMTNSNFDGNYYYYISSHYFGESHAIMPILKLDPSQVVFASEIVAVPSGVHQIAASEAYPAAAAGSKNYKLTVLDSNLNNSFSNLKHNGITITAASDLLVENNNNLLLTVDIGDADNTSVRYKIVNENGALMSYGIALNAPRAGQNTISFATKNMVKGKYHTYVWLQKDNAYSSFTASKPHYFKMEVISPPTVIEVGGGGGGGGASYTVIFDTNGGSAIAKQSVSAGAKVKKPTDPTKEGFTFVDWYTDKALTTAYSFDAIVKADFTLYAKWEANLIEEPPIDQPTSSGFAAFITGFEDNTFRGGSSMTREQFVAILFRLKNMANQPAADKSDPSFNDVSAVRWSYDAIEWAKQAGIIEADAAGNFYPAMDLTRADMAIMLVKADNLSELAENVFNDIEDHPACADILKAVHVGIFTGYPDGTFRPNESTNRYEAVAALVRYLLLGEPNDEMWQKHSLTLNDIASSHWAYKYVVLAVKGIQ
ncbi:MAG: S-layer homology domain-containing protein [Clostridiales bacterium]|nr:S-layer homology domain-containing protein [Clostridiales bacterium]